MAKRMSPAEQADIRKHIETDKPVIAEMPLGPGGVGRAVKAARIVSNPETYSESARGIKITAERAIKEIRDHGADPGEFFKEVGKKSHYMAHHILNWLGY